MNKNTSIAHYRIIRPLGKGGMGEVYLAHDTRLDREVAIKVLPESVRDDPDRLARFQREARAAASLKHPNIATIHAIEEVDGVLFIVMEYVEGTTLTDLIPSDGMDIGGPNAVGRTQGSSLHFFDVFIPLADALAHAHESGRVHRDLKPANIMIAEDGTPKILDFGLARILATHNSQPTNAVDTQAPTRTMDAAELNRPPPDPVSQPGAVLGTPAYMSPEQARGQDTDHRSDLFSFGVMMYQALTGRKPFEGYDYASVVSSILKDDPEPVTAHKPVTPYQLWWVIRKCLNKDRGCRIQTAPELHEDLKTVQHEVQSGTILSDTSNSAMLISSGDPASTSWFRTSHSAFSYRPVTGIAIALLLAVFAATLSWYFKPSPEPPLRKFRISTGAQHNNRPVISPDGKMIAFFKNGSLWIQDLDQVEPRRIPGTEGIPEFVPAWSPESDYLAYAVGNSLRKISLQGGPGVLLCETPYGDNNGGRTWGSGKIIFSKGSSLTGDMRLYEVSDQGGLPELYMAPDSAGGELSYMAPYFLPDGESLMFIVGKSDNTWDLVVQSGGNRHVIMENLRELIRFLAYSPTGHLLYSEYTGGIWAIPFSIERLETEGDSFFIMETNSVPSISRDGTLVYGSVEDAIQRQLMRVSRKGQVEGMIGQAQIGIINPDLSPDGRYIAVSAIESSNRNIWIHEAERSVKTRITTDINDVGQPAWSPDGRWLAFSSEGDLFVKSADGSGETLPLITGSQVAGSSAWSPDGRYIVYYGFDPQSGTRDLWYVPVTLSTSTTPDAGQPVALTQTPEINEALPHISPDSRYVAYQSNETGRHEVYIRIFPEWTDRIQVSIGGGVHPRWGSHGNEIFYVEEDRLMVVKIETQPRLSAGAPQPVFTAESGWVFDPGLTEGPYIRMYDVTPDGQRFVMIRSLDPNFSPTITVVQNWYAEFKNQ